MTDVPNRYALITWGVTIVALAGLPPSNVLNSYTLSIFNTLFVFAVLTSSLDLLVGYTGYMSLMHATFFGLAGYVSAQGVMTLGLPYFAAFSIAMIVVAVIAGIIGLISLRTSGIYFGIITFAVAIIGQRLFGKLEFLTGGSTGLPGVPPLEISGFALESVEAYYYLFLVLLVGTLVVKWFIVNSRTGRALKAIRKDERLAASVGINTLRYKMYVFIVSALFSGVAGSVWVHYNQFIGPGTGGFFRSFMLFIMVVVGGAGSILGPLFGTGIVVIVRDYLELASPPVMNILFGGLLMVVIIFSPEGVYPWLRDLARGKTTRDNENNTTEVR